MIVIMDKGKKKRRRTESEAQLKVDNEVEDPEIYREEMREVAMKRQMMSHELFQVPKLTMREGIMRVLE